MTYRLPDEILFDRRLQERFIRQKLLTREALNQWLAQLPDTEEQGARTDLDALARAHAEANQDTP